MPSDPCQPLHDADFEEICASIQVSTAARVATVAQDNRLIQREKNALDIAAHHQYAKEREIGELLLRLDGARKQYNIKGPASPEEKSDRLEVEDLTNAIAEARRQFKQAGADRITHQAAHNHLIKNNKSAALVVSRHIRRRHCF